MSVGYIMAPAGAGTRYSAEARVRRSSNRFQHIQQLHSGFGCKRDGRVGRGGVCQTSGKFEEGRPSFDDSLSEQQAPNFASVEKEYLQFPARAAPSMESEENRRMVKVNLSVEYRVPMRQILCIGGSQMPFGWSFLSIAKVPMTWNSGDKWTAQVELPVGQRVEYKYVILEEQEWTKLENDTAEGVVSIQYRTGTEPGHPPDLQTIQKQMAIVAWQPGPNRVLEVPTEAEIEMLKPGQSVARTPARPRQQYIITENARYAIPDTQKGTEEYLSLSEDGTPVLTRRDVWGFTS